MQISVSFVWPRLYCCFLTVATVASGGCPNGKDIWVKIRFSNGEISFKKILRVWVVFWKLWLSFFCVVVFEKKHDKMLHVLCDLRTFATQKEIYGSVLWFLLWWDLWRVGFAVFMACVISLGCKRREAWWVSLLFCGDNWRRIRFRWVFLLFNLNCIAVSDKDNHWGRVVWTTKRVKISYVEVAFKKSESRSLLLKTLTVFFVCQFSKITWQNVAYFICFAYLCDAKGNLWVCFVIPFVMRFVACGVCEFYGLWQPLGCRRREAWWSLPFVLW